AVAAALAVALCWPPAPRPVRPGGGTGERARPGMPLVLTAPAAAGSMFLGLGPTTTALVALAVLVALGVRWGLRERVCQREAVAVAERVLEACDQLATELGAGQSPGAALERAAADWPALAPVAAAFRMGADVPAALRVLADRPGAHDLRLVAGAWQVAHRTGHGLADAVHRVARELRAVQATRRIVRGELASARATARLVAVLPVLALLMGSGSGADPWAFLLGHPVGVACLGAGLGLGWLGLAWIEAIARDVERTA
uniref:type II secretion system F family protein n=1 Tax=Nocardioides sp. SYSU DS0663 TaxID=3416445 RepID=UPI003F4C1382